MSMTVPALQRRDLLTQAMTLLLAGNCSQQ